MTVRIAIFITFMLGVCTGWATFPRLIRFELKRQDRATARRLRRQDASK